VRRLSEWVVKDELPDDERALLEEVASTVQELSRPRPAAPAATSSRRRRPSRLNRVCRRRTSEWRRLGFRPVAARFLATEAGNIERLGSLTPEQLLRIPGIGTGTVQLCEALLGRPLLREKDGVHSGTPLWRRLGVINPRAMEAAGYHTLADLADVTREEFLSHRLLGSTALTRCEELLGTPLPSYREEWIARGLPEPVARRLSSLRIAVPEQLGDLSPAALEERGFQRTEIAALRRWAGVEEEVHRAAPVRTPPQSEGDQGDPVWAYWYARGIRCRALHALMVRNIRDLDDLRRLGRDAIRRLPGFGPHVLARLANDLGTGVTSATYWLEQGLTPSIANVLDRARIRGRDDLAAMTREEFLATKGLAEVSLRRCEELLGHPLPSAVATWTGHGLSRRLAWRLSRLRVLSREDLRRLTPEALRQLALDPEDAGRLAALAAIRGEE